MEASVELLARPHIRKEQLPNLSARGQSSSRMQASTVTGKLSRRRWWPQGLWLSTAGPQKCIRSMPPAAWTATGNTLSAIFTPTDHHGSLNGSTIHHTTTARAH